MGSDGRTLVLTPPADAGRLAAGIAGAATNLERPDAFNAAVGAFRGDTWISD
jgi:hypothetical protein